MNIIFEFENIDEFYKECEILEEPQSTSRFNTHYSSNDKYFRGATNEEIKARQFGYVEGVDLLPDFSDAFQGFGASKYIYRWNEIDGDEMNMERAYEGMPFLKEKRRAIGNGSGKFITLDIVISENCSISHKDMSNKAYAAVGIANRLESLGYRIAINCVSYVAGVGYLKDDYLSYSTVKIPLKKFEEPTNLPLIINAVSPWMFRYWIFGFYYAKLKTSYGLGQSRRMAIEDTRERIIIDNGDCLCKEDVKRKLKEISILFELAGNEEGEFEKV